MSRILLVLAILTLGVAPSALASNAILPFARYGAEDRAIYLAVCDYMFPAAQGLAHQYGCPETYFISLNRKDAPEDLLKILRQNGRRIRAGHLWKQGTGVELDLNEITHESNSRAVVNGGYLYGYLGGAWGPFTLIKEEGGWKVTNWHALAFAQTQPMDKSAVVN